jgi:hypothetical protein
MHASYVDNHECPRCGDKHLIIACPYVKAIDFQDGNLLLIRRVEFLTPADYGPQAPKPAVANVEPAAGPADYQRMGQT